MGWPWYQLLLTLWSAVYLIAEAQVCSVSQTEYDALFALYNATDGANWANPSGGNWSFPSSLYAPCAELWYGLTCQQISTNSCTITGLSLINNNLQGTLPSDLSQLIHLRNLTLIDQYGLFGEIPTQIGSLANLSSVVLSSSYLGSTIPSEVGQLQLLTELSIGGCYVSGVIPSEIGLLRSLEQLQFDFCMLEGAIPTQIGLLSSLKTLYLDNIYINETIPIEIGYLERLQSLQLSNLYLTGNIPSSIGELSSLEQLLLNSVSLTGPLPSSIGYLSALMEMQLSDLTSLSGSIPTEIGLLTSLKELFLAGIDFDETIPTEIGRLTALQVISFIDLLSISGTIPTEIGGLTELNGFILDSIGISGSVPSEIGNWQRLQQLTISTTSLQGSIPTEIGLLTTLSQFTCSDTSLSGAIPSEIGSITAISLFELVSTSISGSLPTQIGNWKYLTELNIFDSLLTGKLPIEIGNWSDVSKLQIELNYLSDSIPYAIGNLSLLTYVSFSSNLLSGTIPIELSNCSLLDFLSLMSNLIEGTVSAQLLQGWKNITALYLNENELTGTVPSILTDFFALGTIDLSSNRLSGPIPSSAWNCAGCYHLTLDLSSNSLTGSVPFSSASFSSSSSTNVIGSSSWSGFILLLDKNLLTDALPVTLFRWDPTIIDLSSNYLTGTIQSAQLYNELIFIDLSFNQFSGNLPFFKLSRNLYYYSMANNSFSGSFPFGIANSSAQSIGSNAFGSITMQFFSIANNSICCELPIDYINSNDFAPSLLNLRGNLFNGSINALNISNRMHSLDLSHNKLIGTFPNSFGGKSLKSLSLRNNLLSGSINLICSQSIQLSELFIGSNYFIGNLSGINCLTNISVLSIESNRFTGSLTAISSLRSLQQLIAYDNELTGTFPAFLSSLANLKILLLSGNKLTGNLVNSFNKTIQTVLTAIDLSSNSFTGPLPSNLFTLPSIGSVALSKNCFSGSLPTEICSATNLKVLILNGITSGQSCQYKFKAIRTSNAFVSTKGPLQGTLLDCLWSLPKLMTLHLSSNALLGTLGKPINYNNNNSKLTSIVLSYNRLSGSIPIELQALPFTTLMLSNNRLKGSLSQPLAIANATVNLVNNRITGFIPISYSKNNVSQVNVMRGNLFNCDEEHPKPTNDADVDAKTTSCGSSQLNNSYFSWIIAFSSSLLLIATVLWYFGMNEQFGLYQQHITELLWECMNFLLVFLSCLISFTTNLSLYFDWSSNVRLKRTSPMITPSSVINNNNSLSTDSIANPDNSAAIVGASSCQCTSTPVVSFLLLVQSMLKINFLLCFMWSFVCCVPIYLIIKYAYHEQYSTHTEQYAWIPSAVFLTGSAPACVLLLLFLSAILCYYLGVTSAESFIFADIELFEDKSQSMQQSSIQQSTQIVSLARKYLTRNAVNSALLITTHVVIVVSINIAYLYILLSGLYGPQVVTVVQLAMSVFKQVWDSLVIPNAVKSLVSTGPVSETDSYSTPDKTPGSSSAPTAPSTPIDSITIDSLKISSTIANPLSLESNYNPPQAMVPAVSKVQETDRGHYHKLMILFACAISNSLLIPFVVTLFENSLCFLELFTPQSVVTEAFSYDLASRQTCKTFTFSTANVSAIIAANSNDDSGGTGGSNGVPILTFSQTSCISLSAGGDIISQFYPPFMYSFQCGASFFTSYTPVIVFGMAFRMLWVAIKYLLRIYYLSLISVDTTEPVVGLKGWIAARVGPLMQRFVLSSLQTLQSGKLVVRLLMDGLLMLCFGLSSPIVALMLVFCQLIELSFLVLTMSGNNDFSKAQTNHLKPVVAVEEGNTDSSNTQSSQSSPSTNTNWKDGDILTAKALSDLSLRFESELSQFLQDIRWVPTELMWVSIHTSSVLWALLLFDMVGDGDVHHPIHALWAPLLALLVPVATRLCVWASSSCCPVPADSKKKKKENDQRKNENEGIALTDLSHWQDHQQ